jgi:hypothetical protein
VADPPLRLEDWDIATSPSHPGLITETFRQRPESVRSDNPPHSISAIGARAVELTADHGSGGWRRARCCGAPAGARIYQTRITAIASCSRLYSRSKASAASLKG